MHVSSHLLARLVSVLFMVGGSCFALASTPFASERVSVGVIGWTYVIGAVFFTSAAAVQLLATANADALAAAPDPRAPVRVRPLRADARSVLWWACAVQLVGTLYFNVDTIHALDVALDAQEEILQVWRPEAIGSICFLAASLLALLAPLPDGRRTGSEPRTVDGSSGWWNMVGSILFGVSTVAGEIVGAPDEVRDAALMNSTTMLGSLCFVVGAWIVRPRAVRPGRPG